VPLFRHVLVPLDGSPHSVRALELALELAQLATAQLDAIHVIDTSQIQQVGRLLDQDPSRIREQLNERAMGILIDANTVARKVGVDITTHMAEGVPYETVVDHARSRGVDLIVLGRIGTRGPRRILIGSVTERIIEMAHCHVMVIR